MSLLDALLLDPAPFNVWIAKRTDGLKGSGTASDPYDGSTQARFDGVMSLFAAQSNVAIHLGPGEFQTNGYNDTTGWQARPGMKIIGSGMDVTVLKLVNVAPVSAAHYFAIGHSLATVADTFEVCDLTIDCNLASANTNAACGGVRVMGNHARIQRVKVKNWGTKSSSVPCFALSVITAYPDTGPSDVVNAGIEDCVVIEPYDPNSSGSVGPATALHAGSPSGLSFTKEGHAKSPSIRNCFVDCGVTTPNPNSTLWKYRALSMGWCRGGVVEGNHVYNTEIGGPYQDQRSVRDLIVRNNFYKNVAKATVLNLGQLGSSLGSGTNNFSRSGTVATITGITVTSLVVGDRVRLVTSPGDYTGVYQVRTVPTSSEFTVGVPSSGPTPVSVTSVQRVLSVGRAIIEGNVIELAPGVSVASAVSIVDNNDAGSILEPPDYLHGDVIVRNNKIRYVDGAVPTDSGATLIEVKGAKSLHVKDNVLDTIATVPLANLRCGSATYFNNRTPGGVLERGKNNDNGRNYDELETDAEDAFIMGFIKRT